jgi:hypothetical protein
MSTTRYFSRDGGPPFAVTADGDDIPDELDGCEEVSAADMDAAEQAHTDALEAFAQAEAERVDALDVERSDIEAAMADVFSPEIAASIAARLV